MNIKLLFPFLVISFCLSSCSPKYMVFTDGLQESRVSCNGYAIFPKVENLPHDFNKLNLNRVNELIENELNSMNCQNYGFTSLILEWSYHRDNASRTIWLPNREEDYTEWSIFSPMSIIEIQESTFSLNVFDAYVGKYIWFGKVSLNYDLFKGDQGNKNVEEVVKLLLDKMRSEIIITEPLKIIVKQ